MPRSKPYDEITNFLGISLSGLASFLGITPQYLGLTGRSLRSLSIPMGRKIRELHMIILRVEKILEEEGEIPADQVPEQFLEKRLKDVECDLILLNRKISKHEKKKKILRQASMTYNSLWEELTDKDEIAAVWLRNQQAFVVMDNQPDPDIGKLLWQRKMLLIEQGEVMAELARQNAS
jgi:hypothetical protein